MTTSNDERPMSQLIDYRTRNCNSTRGQLEIRKKQIGTAFVIFDSIRINELPQKNTTVYKIKQKLLKY